MGLLILLLIAGLILFLLWYLFIRSILWVFQPLIEYMEGKEAEKFVIEGFEKEKLEDIDLEKVRKNKVKILLTHFDGYVSVPKPILQKAKKEPRRLPGTNLWVYKDFVVSFKPTEEKIKEIFGE